MIIAGILSGLEVILPFFMANLPQGLFSVFAIVLTTAALIARVVAQKGVEE